MGRRLALFVALHTIAVSCGGEDTPATGNGGGASGGSRAVSGGAPVNNGGTHANGGTTGPTTATGGTPSSSGGSSAGGSSAGGRATGGATASGGAGPAGGVASTGGTAGTGGAPTGGIRANGGQTGSGGSSAGGTRPSGGAASGGRASGGSAGGGPASGGTASGGNASGGTATGGTASGGTATGGTASGGTATGGTASGGTGNGTASTLGGCSIFPADNPWNQDISSLPVHANSATYLANMSPSTAFHPDWGTVSDGYGIPFMVGTGATPQPLTWTASWGEEMSDPLPCTTGSNQFCYPIPLTCPIEGGASASSGADRHVLYLDTAGAPDNCTLYELYNAQNPTGGSGWTAANGAIFHLGSNALRPDGWTSADAAGLPVLPGLVRFDEATAGEIRHAIRFTVASTSQGYIHPATHAAGSANANLPPMGLRLRLKASFATGSFSGPTLAILTAMKKYGIILADNGSNWYISGESNEGWAPYMDDLLSDLGQLHGSDFEVVNTGPVSTEGL